jgi:formate dehydrogenase subunit gamma
VISKINQTVFTRWILALLFGITLLAVTSSGFAQSSVRPPESAAVIPIPNPAADLWRNVRSREDIDQQDPGIRAVAPNALIKNLWLQVQSGEQEIAGTSQVKGVDSGVLINTRGEQWRNFRMNQLLPNAGYLLSIMILLIAVFFGVRGTMKISEGRSGLKILRFSLSQRAVHWTVAITFLILGFTGLILLFGRAALIPILGAKIFGVVAFVAKRLHDFIGPLFGAALILQFFMFIRGNLPHMRDLTWILKGGGLFGGHASAHRYNAGEKGWFWIAMLGGLVVVVTGLILDFPMFGQDRLTMELTHVIHSIGAILILSASFGHIYMGTIGTEGTFEVMKTGYCDANWAKEHHDLWYEEMQSQGEIDTMIDNDQVSSVSPVNSTNQT